jgi:hypothetical protein
MAVPGGVPVTTRPAVFRGLAAGLRSVVPGLSVSVFFVLLLYAQSRAFMTLPSLGQPLLLAAGLSVLVWVFSLACCRNLAGASVMAAVILLFNGVHGYLLGYVPDGTLWRIETGWEEPRRLVLALSGLWVVATCCVAARRQPRVLVRPARFVKDFLAANLVFAVALVVVIEVQRPAMHAAPPIQAERTAGAPIDSRQLPTIVNLVLDGYARADVLEDLYAYDNRPFLAELERMGFRVLREARCNYIQTALSMASSLNMRYLDDVAATHSNRYDRTTLASLIGSSEVVALLRARGYEIVGFPSGYSYTDSFDADVWWSAGTLNELSVNWLSGSWFGSLTCGGRVSPSTRHMRRVEAILRTLPKASTGDRPRYVYAHLVAPHPPFLFDADGPRKTLPKDYSINDGSHLIGTGEMTMDSYRTAYVEQLRYVSIRVQAMLKDLIERSRRPLVVLLHADHGPGSGLSWKSAEKSDVRERSAILCAVYFHDRRYEALRDDLTSVNLHRVILSQYAGYDLPLLPDRTFYSSWTNPYRFIETTERTGRKTSDR